MFLSKRSNGIYYLWYDDDLGRRHKVSTGCALKTDALKFLQDFKQSEHNRKVELHQVSLQQFAKDYLTYSKGIQDRLLKVLRQYTVDYPQLLKN